jgi:hypothetical protein
VRHFACSWSLAIIAIFALIGLTPAASADEAESSLRLRGFGTLGMARSSSDQTEFIRDLSQPRGISNHWSSRIDSLLGVQANWHATDELELVGQVVSRYRYDKSRDPELMWAFAKWEPDARMSLRGGRIGADFMMAADSRLVGYSHLAARPAPDFFGPLFFSYIDGVDASLTLPLGSGLVRGKLFGGATPEKTSGTPGIWDTNGSPVNGIVLDYLLGSWQFRANMAQIRFASDVKFAPLPAALRMYGADAAADALVSDGRTARFRSLGVIYDEGPLQVQGMLNTIAHETGFFQDSRAGYVLAGYRLDTVTPYVGVSWWKSRSRNISSGLPADSALDMTFNTIMAASAVDQTTYTVGARWDLYANLALKAQWDAIRGTAASVFSFQQSKPGWNGRTDVLSLIADFVF